MRKAFLFCCFLSFSSLSWGQKDSLALGEGYADDQLYLTVSYAQLINQPTSITRSGFSYALSTGFIKDITLNQEGTISFGIGIGYGYQNINHQLRVEEINGSTIFGNSTGLTDNTFTVQNLEFPLEIRWRTSSSNKYDFWRIYTGIKFLYNLGNRFEFIENSNRFSYKNVSAFNNFQYGLILSVGYDAINAHLFYGLTPIFSEASFTNESINTKIIQFGIVFYIL